MISSFQSKRILVVAAHPDDEVLGPGATIHRLVSEAGCTAHALVLGEGLTSRADSRDAVSWEGVLADHHENARIAANLIGYSEIQVRSFPDNRFDEVPLLDLVKVIEAVKSEFRPDVLFTHHGGDVNIDHRRTLDAVVAATRPMSDEPVQSILSFEVPSSTEWQLPSHPTPFRPNVFVAVNPDNLNAKVNAMDCYQFERRSFPHPRSSEALRNLAARRGIEAGMAVAEAFVLQRSRIGI